MGQGGRNDGADTPSVLVSTLRLTLGLATLPLLGAGLLLTRVERTLTGRPPDRSSDAKPAPEPIAPARVPHGEKATAPEALPERRDVEAALAALTTATLPRAARVRRHGKPARKSAEARADRE